LNSRVARTDLFSVPNVFADKFCPSVSSDCTISVDNSRPDDTRKKDWLLPLRASKVASLLAVASMNVRSCRACFPRNCFFRRNDRDTDRCPEFQTGYTRSRSDGNFGSHPIDRPESTECKLACIAMIVAAKTTLPLPSAAHAKAVITAGNLRNATGSFLFFFFFCFCFFFFFFFLSSTHPRTMSSQRAWGSAFSAYDFPNARPGVYWLLWKNCGGQWSRRGQAASFYYTCRE